MSQKYECGKCQKVINPDGEKIEEKAHYIRGPSTRQVELMRVNVALKHNDKSREIRDKLVEERGINLEKANRKIARGETEVDRDDLEREEVESPNISSGNTEIVQVNVEEKEKEIMKTAIVCENCVDDEDEVIW